MTIEPSKISICSTGSFIWFNLCTPSEESVIAFGSEHEEISHYIVYRYNCTEQSSQNIKMKILFNIC